MPGPELDVEERPCGPQAITGADLVSALIGPGETAGPARCLSELDFEAAFGRPAVGDPLGTAFSLFFQNNGGPAWVARAPTLAAGLAALDGLAQVDLLATPGFDAPADQVQALAFAERRGAFLVLDLPAAATTRADADAWLAAAGALRRPNAAAWFPQVVAGGRVCAASGAIAGMMARVASERGVWKAPGGPTAQLYGVTALAHPIAQADADALGRQGVNQVRHLPNGMVSWGARTLAGDGSEWKYVSVRRLALYLERSIAAGLQWVVFEPNADPLWAAVRSSVESFLATAWRDGALQGAKLEQAAFVRCDRSTMTQNDIDAGRLVVEIGIAPVRPAEFVILRIGLWTADAKP